MFDLIVVVAQLFVLIMKTVFDGDRRAALKIEKRNQDIEAFGVSVHENRLRLTAKLLDLELRRLEAGRASVELGAAPRALEKQSTDVLEGK